MLIFVIDCFKVLYFLGGRNKLETFRQFSPSIFDGVIDYFRHIQSCVQYFGNCKAVVKYKLIIFLALSVEHNKLNKNPQSRDMADISQCVCVCIFASSARGHEIHGVHYSRERSVNQATRKNLFFFYICNISFVSLFFYPCLVSSSVSVLPFPYLINIFVIHLCPLPDLFPSQYRQCSGSGLTVII